MHLYVHSSTIYNSQDDVWYYVCVCVYVQQNSIQP